MFDSSSSPPSMVGPTRLSPDNRRIRLTSETSVFLTVATQLENLNIGYRHHTQFLLHTNTRLGSFFFFLSPYTSANRNG